MKEDEFRSHILDGPKDEYVSEEALEYLRELVEYTVIERSAMEKDQIEQTECISVALSGFIDNYTDADLIDLVKEKLCDGNRDIQKYQLRDGEKIPTQIEIWRHGSGYSAFALT